MKTIGGGSEGRLGLNNLLFSHFKILKIFFYEIIFFKGGVTYTHSRIYSSFGTYLKYIFT